MNLILKITVVALFCGVTSSCIYEREVKWEKERHLFEQVHTGMSKGQVKAILGEPDQINYTIDSQKCIFDYFTSDKFGWSTMPSVSFDTSDKVIDKYYGDGR